MLPMELKLRLKRTANNQIHVTFFIGEAGQTLQNAGSILVHIGEWQLFGAAVLHGSKIMQKHLSLLVEGEEEALREDDN